MNLTPEEIALLRAEYQKYLDNHLWKYGEPLAFSTWCRAVADEAKERAKYKDN